MKIEKILLTTPTYPYPTLPANDSLTDATGQRFTHGDGIFSSVSHTHCFANHILAQNINIPSVVLEYPEWKNFTEEVKKGYTIIGISSFPVHLDTVIKMCIYIREHSPETKILLGSYGAQAFASKYDEETQKKYADHVVLGEGVTFLRNLLGEDVNRPIEQKLMPKAGGTLRWIDKYPAGNIGFLVSGLGCPGACDFCSTTAMYGLKRKELLSPQELVEHIHLYHKYFPEVRQVFVIEEDHFRHPEYMIKTKEYWESNPDVMEKLDWLAFGSVDNIVAFAEKYGWNTIAEIGVGAIFIGVESKFAGEHGYDKRAKHDAREIFNRLHSMGIRTLGAWICGWDFHDHSNIYEDLNYFVACYPTFEQLTRLSPFPGTVLYDKLREEGRVMDVPWEDVHFWSGAQVNISLESHETLNLTEYGYDLLYKTWGPSILRRMDVILNGYKFCMESSNPLMRNHKSVFFRNQASLHYMSLGALDRFAPNGVVRRRVRKMEEKYRALVGEPTPLMRVALRKLERRALKFKLKNDLNPYNRFPKEEPFKRYTYHKDPAKMSSAIPYTTEWPNRPFRYTAGKKYRFVQALLRTAIMRLLSGSKSGNPEIDRYIIDTLKIRTSAGF